MKTWGPRRRARAKPETAPPGPRPRPCIVPCVKPYARTSRGERTVSTIRHIYEAFDIYATRARRRGGPCACARAPPPPPHRVAAAPPRRGRARQPVTIEVLQAAAALCVCARGRETNTYGCSRLQPKGSPRGHTPPTGRAPCKPIRPRPTLTTGAEAATYTVPTRCLQGVPPKESRTSGWPSPLYASALRTRSFHRSRSGTPSVG